MDSSVPAVLVLSHGPFCDGLVKSTKMIFGDVGRLEALPLEEGEDPGQYMSDFRALVDKYDGNVFICVDIVGGTPFNTLMMCARETRFSAISGINMPILLEVLSNRESMHGDELAAASIDGASVVDSNLANMLESVYLAEE